MLFQNFADVGAIAQSEGYSLAVVGQPVAVAALGQQVGKGKGGGCTVCHKDDGVNALSLQGLHAAEAAGEAGEVRVHGDGQHAVLPGCLAGESLAVLPQNPVEGGFPYQLAAGVGDGVGGVAVVALGGLGAVLFIGGVTVGNVIGKAVPLGRVGDGVGCRTVLALGGLGTGRSAGGEIIGIGDIVTKFVSQLGVCCHPGMRCGAVKNGALAGLRAITGASGVIVGYIIVVVVSCYRDQLIVNLETSIMAMGVSGGGLCCFKLDILGYGSYCSTSILIGQTVGDSGIQVSGAGSVCGNPALVQSIGVGCHFLPLQGPRVSCTILIISAVADGRACTCCISGIHSAFTALGFHLSILGDRDVAAGATIAAADAGTAFSALGGDFRAASDGNVSAVSMKAAADAGTAADEGIATVAGGLHLGTASDGDVAAVFVRAAADAGTAIAAVGDDFRAAGDGDVAAGATRAAADAGTGFSAGGPQAALGFVFVGNGQHTLTAIVGGVLLHAGTVHAALEGIFPVQLQGHIAVARNLDSSFTGNIITSKTAGSAHIDFHAVQGDIGFGAVRHIDGDRRLASVILGVINGVADDNVHILNGHIGSGVLRCRDGDGVGGGGFVVGLDDDRGIVRHRVVGAVGNGLSAFRGIHGDAALGKVICIRKGGYRQAANKQQGHHAG